MFRFRFRFSLLCHDLLLTRLPYAEEISRVFRFRFRLSRFDANPFAIRRGNKQSV